ncbi:hypothetical protein [Novosphingobium sp. AP12]|uniref:hypothetical protein n=1 Tax=Novosphingobium sp. AP12 TaxID=1144305 RepID=UPI000271FFBC|nr:hypothetical protein [Novosphingobium sp. AP12]EJL34123.1 hypothetical protein PMI02_00788 [Novosphingobium sp. AP12]
MDITTQSVSDTAAIHIKGPDGNYLYDDGKPVRIIVHGPASSVFAELEDRQANRAVKRLNDNDGRPNVAPIAQREAEVADDLASITVAFENLDYPPAAEKHGKDLFRALYADKKLGFIGVQIQKALRDWGNFKGASTVS